jgi:hypothetical protein
MTKNILIEAIVVGVALVVVGMLLHLGASKFMKHDMNNNVVLAVHFFVAGVVVYLLAGYSGIKSSYFL